MPSLRSIRILPIGVLICAPLFAQLTLQQKAQNLESFELVWSTIRDHHPDPKLNGLDWQAIHDTTRAAIEKAQSTAEVRRILADMTAKLNSSHYTIIPENVYQDTGAADTQDQGTVVRFGNLPEMHLEYESRALPDGTGYIRFSEFLDPVSLIPKIEQAVKTFAKAPGIILDLRGNPGGIGIMAQGIAGFFIDKTGLKLGDMKTRDTTLKFTIFPRPQTYSGPLAILIDGRSASTSEILAAGLQDLKRARLFGTRSAGAALPSDIIRLPNGDGFQFAQASYASVSGKVLEGAGVTPDVIVNQPQDAAGRDFVIEAADAWIQSTHR